MAVGDRRHGPGVAVRRVRDGCWIGDMDLVWLLEE